MFKNGFDGVFRFGPGIKGVWGDIKRVFPKSTLTLEARKGLAFEAVLDPNEKAVVIGELGKRGVQPSEVVKGREVKSGFC